MSLLKIIEEQIIVGFIGRVNILRDIGSEYLGNILIKENYIVSSSYRDNKGKRALFSCLIDSLIDDSQMKFIIEPEVIETESELFHLDFKSFKHELEAHYNKYLENKHLKPPRNIRLLVAEDFLLKSKTDVSLKEFKLLTCITEYQSIDQIYSNVDLLPHEITTTLVSLKQKKALKVLKPRINS